MPEIAVQRPGDFLSACDRLKLRTIEVDYLGAYAFSLDVRGRSIAEEVLRVGRFQNELFQLAQSLGLSCKQMFVNVGANIGTTCVNAFHAGYRDIVAFEPVAKNFELLERNLAALSSEASITLHNLALGATDAVAAINLNPHSTGRHSLVREFGHGSEQVKVRRIDDVVPMKPGILWIDTEGFELDVLRGAERYLREQASALCIEITPALLGPDKLAALADLLEASFGTFVGGDGKAHSRLLSVPGLGDGEQADVFCINRRD